MAKPFKGTINVDIRDSEPVAGASLYVGRNPGEPVTEDYPRGAALVHRRHHQPDRDRR